MKEFQTTMTTPQQQQEAVDRSQSPIGEASIMVESYDQSASSKDVKNRLPSSDTKDIIRGFVKTDRLTTDSPFPSRLPERINHSTTSKLKKKVDFTETDEISQPQAVSVEIKQHLTPSSDKVITPAPIRRITYSSKVTCFEFTLLVLNFFLFIGILATSLVLVRLLAYVHQKDIANFLAYLVTLQ